MHLRTTMKFGFILSNNIERMKLDSDGLLILPNNTVIGENSKVNFGDTSYNVVLGNNIQCNQYRNGTL